VASVAIASIALVVAAGLAYATTARVLAFLRWRDTRETAKATDDEKEALAKALDELRSRCMRLEQARGLR
jgi:hypothetical protein